MCVCVGGGFGTAYSLPSLSRLTRTSEDRPSVSPRCSSGGWLQLPRPGISHFKRAFVPVPSGWVPHTVLPRGWRVCSERGCGARGWTGVLGLLVPCLLGLPPSASRCIGTYGGGGGERTAKVDSGDATPTPRRLPAWRGTGTVCASLSPRGKFRAARCLSPSSAPAKWLKGEGFPRRAGPRRGVCVWYVCCMCVCVCCVRVCVRCESVRASVWPGRARPRGGAYRCDVVWAGRALPRASAAACCSEGSWGGLNGLLGGTVGGPGRSQCWVVTFQISP